MIKFKNFYDAWRYLNTTEVFWHKNLEKGFSGWYRDENGKLDFNMFQRCLDIDVEKVNPKTCRIDDNNKLNTKVRVWLECGEPYCLRDDCDTQGRLNWEITWAKNNGLDPDEYLDEVHYNSHIIDYDCGGDTFEEAIVNLANKVWKRNKR